MATIEREKAATIADVARRAGVAKSTASRLLSGARQGTPWAREAVERACDELGYRPDPNAQKLARGQSQNTIGLFTHFLDLGVGTKTLRRVQQLLGERGFSVPLHVTISGIEHQDHLALLQNVCAQRYRAIVGAQAWLLREREWEELAQYGRNGGPVVLYDHTPRLPIACDQVLFDMENGFRAAVAHLAALGHTRIGTFFAPMRHPETSPQLRAFERVLGEFGLKLRPHWLFRGQGHIEHDLEGALAAQTFLDLAPSKRPSAMLIVSDSAAMGFATVLSRSGLQIPRDLSLVGHDDKPIAALCSPPLTTISYPVEAIAARVVELLCERLDGTYNGPPRTEIISGNLVERHSTAAQKG